MHRVRARAASAVSLSAEAALARDLADHLANRVLGHVSSAAYVVGTYRQWAGSAGQRGLPSTRSIGPDDTVLVVKLFGDFESIHSRPYSPQVPPHDTVALVVYNATRKAVAMTSFAGGGGPSPASPQGVHDPQLVALGDPHEIDVQDDWGVRDGR